MAHEKNNKQTETSEGNEMKKKIYKHERETISTENKKHHMHSKKETTYQIEKMKQMK